MEGFDNCVISVSKDRNGKEFVFVEWKKKPCEEALPCGKHRIKMDNIFIIFAFLFLIVGLWLSSALLLLDKSYFNADGQSQRIIIPSSDGYNCNNLALNFWPFISDKYKRRLPSKLISKWFFVLLMLCAGDVHPNPGPGPTDLLWLFLLLILCSGDIELNPGPVEIIINASKREGTEYEVGVKKEQVRRNSVVVENQFCLLNVIVMYPFI